MILWHVLRQIPLYLNRFIKRILSNFEKRDTDSYYENDIDADAFKQNKEHS